MCLANPHGRTSTFSDFWPRLSDFRVFNDIDDFDFKAVNVLNYILLHTDADIVVSSDWYRFFNTDMARQDFYVKQKIIKMPIEWLDYRNSTAMNPVSKRQESIKKWQTQNQCNNWIAIDDLFLNELPLDNFCWITHTDLGITEQDVYLSILEKLNILL